MRVLSILFGILVFFNCKITQTSIFYTDINTDTLPAWYPNDPDSSLLFYYNPDTSLFADFPKGMQEMHRNHCASCHSNYLALLDTGAGIAPIINTWAELEAFGPAKYYFAASTGSMPPETPIPDSVLRSANQSLVSAANRGLLNTNVYIEGIQNTAINEIAHKYCATCHGFNGINLHKANLSTYEKWKGLWEDIEYVLEEKEMVPEEAINYEEWQLDTASQYLLLDWIKNGLPNGSTTDTLARK